MTQKYIFWIYRPSYTYYTAMDAERLANGNTLIADAVSNGGTGFIELSR